MLEVQPHPLLDLAAFVTEWPTPLGDWPAPPWMRDLAALDALQPFAPPDEAQKKHVRDLLRWGGFKPSGRSKPCNEYIRTATAEGNFPFINAAVDATNLAALHGGIPVSTVDLDRLVPPLGVGVAEAGTRYVFNPSGQEIDVSGLLCLLDAEGPCANPVKDSMRAKTVAETRRTLTILWGTNALPGRVGAVAAWHRELNTRAGGRVSDLP
jgi:DNA/RNA-binding domain of Phe-tRNA-synthetase-like protein